MLKLTVLGTFATLLLGGLGAFAFHLTWAAPMVTEAGMWGWIATAFASFGVMAVLVWCEFCQLWKLT